MVPKIYPYICAICIYVYYFIYHCVFLEKISFCELAFIRIDQVVSVDMNAHINCTMLVLQQFHMVIGVKNNYIQCSLIQNPSKIN